MLGGELTFVGDVDLMLAEFTPEGCAAEAELLGDSSEDILVALQRVGDHLSLELDNRLAQRGSRMLGRSGGWRSVGSKPLQDVRGINDIACAELRLHYSILD